MATSLNAAALEAILDKRFTQFEDRTTLLFCQIITGISNRITKESNIQARHLMDIFAKLSELSRDQDQDVQALAPGGPRFGDLPSSRMGPRLGAAARRSA